MPPKNDYFDVRLPIRGTSLLSKARNAGGRRLENVPLHPHLVELLELYRRTYGAHTHGGVLSGEQGPLNRYAVQRWITAIARRAGIGMFIRTSCATPSPPMRSSEACRSRPSPPCSATARWT